MREVLFRGKRKSDGLWVYGAYVARNWYPSWKPDDFGGKVVEESNIIDYEYECLWNEVISESVSEFTGLTDKNGKKIFEGDIILESDGGMDGIPRKVIWNEEWMQYECPLVRRHWAYGTNSSRLWLMRNRDVEVIGNIHDNPELLNR